MLFLPTIAGPMSGSFGALTASHNKGGQYFRLRSTPTDPATVQQMAMRNNMTILSNRWADVLTQAQRDAWDVYATNVPRPNRFGGSMLLSGIAHYVRSNSVRLQADPGGASLPVVDDGPTTYNVGSYEIPIVTTATPFTDLTLIIQAGQPWGAEDGAAMIAWTSRPVSPTKKYFAGPYRVIAPYLGDSGTPIIGVQSETAAFPWSAGGASYVRLNVTRADGRLGDDVQLPVVYS